MRDNIHSNDLVSCFWHFFKKPKYGEIYNTGGGRYSNCSILEALNLVEEISGVEIKKFIQSRIELVITFGTSRV